MATSSASSIPQPVSSKAGNIVNKKRSKLKAVIGNVILRITFHALNIIFENTYKLIKMGTTCRNVTKFSKFYISN